MAPDSPRGCLLDRITVVAEQVSFYPVISKLKNIHEYLLMIFPSPNQGDFIVIFKDVPLYYTHEMNIYIFRFVYVSMISIKEVHVFRRHQDNSLERRSVSDDWS